MWSRLKNIIDWFRCKSSSHILFERLKRYASLAPTTLCKLHKAESHTPCPNSSRFCGIESSIPAINFDAVKDAYCKNKRVSSLPSVDAVMFKGDRFLFVEIKSWQNFEYYQIKTGDSQTVIQKMIVDKARGFKLKPKVEKSMEICRKISHNEHLFDKMPVTYVLVTDVDTVADPLLKFKVQLQVLSYKSVYIPLFTAVSIKQLATTGLDVRYVFCRKFDSFYESL